MNYANYSIALRNQHVPEWIIERLGVLYEDIPGHIIYELIEDDNRMGIGKLSVPYSNEETRTHDLVMLLHKKGYSIETNFNAQKQFALDTLERGVKGLGFAAVAFPVAVVGSVVGGAIWVFRDYWPW